MGLLSRLFGRGKKDDAPSRQDAPTPPAQSTPRPTEQASIPDENPTGGDDSFDSDAFLDSFTPSVSFDFSLSKESLYEGMSLTAASLEDAVRNDQIPITNERIRRGDLVLDTYTVETDAISGGMGSVWRVHHTSWDKDLAMKRPQPRFFEEAGPARKATFVAECENWINLGLHPNIVSCYYVREVSGVPTVFSEWMDGGSLKDALASGALYQGSPDEQAERILDISIQTARGLAYSHEKGLLHLDMKPGNVLLSSGRDAKVADFGLAMSAARLAGAGASANTVGGSLGYTLAYAPHEQAEGARPKAWMDAYAWALTVLEMYAGERNWRTGSEVPSRLDELVSQACVDIPPTMRELLKRCLCDHCDSMSALAEELEGCYAKLTGASYPRQDTASAADVADALNNRALSMLDLQMDDEAERLWHLAIEANPAHLAATYNLALYDWRMGTIDDVEAKRRVLAIKDPRAQELARRLDTETAYADELVEELPALADRSATGATPQMPALYAHYLKDGKRLIKTNHSWMRMVDTQTGKTLVEYDLSEHDENASLSPLAIDEDERFVVSSDAYGMVYVWDVETGRCLHALKGHSGWAFAVAINATGTTMISTGIDRALKTWDVRSGRCRESASLNGGMCTLAIDRAGVWALAGRDYGEILLLSLPDGEEFGHMRGAYEKVEFLQFVERDDDIRGLSCSGGEVRYWDVLGDRCLKTVGGKRCWWDGEDTIYVDAIDRVLRWTLAEESEAAWELSVVRSTEETLAAERAFVESLEQAWAGVDAGDLPAALEGLEAARACDGFENDSRLGELEQRLDGLCHKVDVHAITRMGMKAMHDSYRDVRVAENGFVYLTSSIDFKTWKLGDERPTQFFRDKSLVWETGKLSKVYLADGGARVLCSTYFNRYALLECSADGSKCQTLMSPFLAHERRGFGFCVDPTLERLAYTGKDGTYVEPVGIEGEDRLVLAETPDSLALSAGGRYLFYVDEETGSLVQLDVDEGRTVARFGSGLDTFSEIALDRDEKRVLAMSEEDSCLVIFDVASGEQLATLQLDSEKDYGKAIFSSDGRFVLTHSYGDGGMYVYDATSGALVFELSGTGGVEFFDLSDDMHTLYTTNTEGELRTWHVAYRYGM